MKTLLLVDDDANIRDIVTRRLSDRYHVLTAPDGQAALETATAQPVDLILLDLSMPGLCGSVLLRTLRRTVPDVPVALVTGAHDLDQVAHTLASGAEGCLVKPFSILELERFVDERMAHIAAHV